jgi:hypothetical protein
MAFSISTGASKVPSVSSSISVVSSPFSSISRPEMPTNRRLSVTIDRGSSGSSKESFRSFEEATDIDPMSACPREEWAVIDRVTVVPFEDSDEPSKELDETRRAPVVS